CASGGGGTDKEEPDVRNMTQEELDAIADEAHAANKRCACHAFTPQAQKMAMRADVDSLEHCVFTDDQAIESMLELGKPLVPTLAHRSDRAIEQRRGMGTPAFVIEKMKRIQPVCWKTFQRLHDAGVALAMGTDTQLDPAMGDNTYELEIYVELGMTPAEALATATRNSAVVLGIADEVGTLETGKLADLVALRRNPLDDVTVLQERESIELVMKAGDVVVDRRPGHLRRGVVARDAWDWSKPC
ncbi:MAG: amidohydrolase family protein, partial [Sciscionella sp.]